MNGIHKWLRNLLNYNLLKTVCISMPVFITLIIGLIITLIIIKPDIKTINFRIFPEGMIISVKLINSEIEIILIIICFIVPILSSSPYHS